MKKKIAIGLVLVILVLTALALMLRQNPRGMKDGYYTAEMAEFDEYGWKEYLCIQIKKGKIVSAEFNARNASGFIKAWDNSYMKNMLTVTGTYPNKYTREYVQKLLDQQMDTDIDAISGASNSGNNFKKLAAVAVEQAKKGNSNTKIVESEYFAVNEAE